ncbi:MAG: heavy metal translocating P-type ATPase [Verrucomicrobia bacterium]|nr:heavy metal translocating P-type ATPase [Verrucomicrobiota bacterium]
MITRRETGGRACWKERLLNFLQGRAVHEHSHASEDWRVLGGLAVLCGLLGFLAWSLESFAGVSGAWLVALYVVAMLAGGWDALVDVRASLPKGELDIHFLMVAVALGAASIGAWNEGVLLLFLFSLSGALEAFAFDRTRKEIDSLFKDAPKVAWVRDGAGNFVEVPVESVAPGDVIQIKPGAIFPVDAEVLTGESAADESTLTGEAHPVAKQAGDTLYSGTLNLWGTVEARVLRAVNESAQQKVVQLIQKAQHLKASSQRFTDRFGTGYTLLVLVATLLMFFVWWLGFGIAAFENAEGTRSAFYRAMTLLVVASPCALVLSIPSAILAAIAWGARQGILFRGGVAIEKLVEVDLVCFDKTGTLTTGEMSVARIESFPPGWEAEAARLAYSLEAQGSHPIGQAIQRYGAEQGFEVETIEGFRAMSGMGVEGRTGMTTCVLGRRELMLEGPMAERVRAVPEPPSEYVENWICSGDLVARILLRDTIREESRGILASLRELGIRTVMLTGDRKGTAAAVGAALGIEEVQAELRPEDKVAQIESYSNNGYKVAMLGDGVNDAPSLAAAYVSVAMGIRGSDAALEQSEVVLMRDRIDNFLAARSLSEQATRVIRQNVTIALGTVVVMTLAAAGGMIPLSVGVVAHEGSSALVCLNSLRLLFLRSGQ